MSKDIIIVKPEDKSIVVSKKSGKNIVIGKQSGGGSFPTDYAKESTSQEILTATSTLAKQGSNNNISLTTMDEKLGNVVMMTDAEYQPALDDLATKLD